MKNTSSSTPTVLIIGASRGLGYAIAETYVARGWDVVGTVRGDGRTRLHDLAAAHPGRVRIDSLDIDFPDQIAALRARLDGRVFDILFVNAGVTNSHPEQTVAEVSTEEFVRVMVTNALSPMRVVEALQDLIAADGVIAVMSSGQGSVANNTNGMREVYRASKAALNTCMRSFAARHADGSRAMVLMAPGWVRTDLGGEQAPLSIEDSVPRLVDVVTGVRGQPGLQYLDYRGLTVPW